MSKLIMCLICVIEFSFTQISLGSIKGRVIENGSNYPLIGVNITLKGKPLGASTDVDGNYTIENVPVGTYIIEYNYIGYKAYQQADVVVKPAKITYVNTTLFEDVQSNDVVEVTASFFQKDETKPISAISYSTEEIRRAPGAGGEISRVVSVMPGVATEGAMSQDIIVRGGSPTENGYFIDNIPIPAIAHFQMSTGNSNGPMGILDADLIDNVEFSTGGFNASYGDRLSSIMDISYREGNKDNFDGRFDLNFGGYGGSIEGPISENMSFFISGRNSYLDLIMDNIKEQGNAPRFGDIQGKLTYHINDHQKLTLIHIFGKSGVSNDLESSILNQLDKAGEFNAHQNTTGINWQYTPSTSFFSNTSLSYTSFGSDIKIRYTGLDQVNPEGKLYVNYDTDYSYTHLRNTSYYQWDRNNKIEFGGDARLQSSHFNYLLPERLDEYQNTTQEINVNKNVESNFVGAFVSYSKLSGRFTNTLGLRADYYSHNKKGYISPRFSTTFRMTDKFSINASTGVYYQSVSPYVISQDKSNNDLDNVKSVHNILGFDYLLTENTKLSVELFNKDYQNAPQLPAGIDPLNNSYVLDNRSGFGNGKYVSKGEAYARGIEFMIQKKLATDFYGTISASYFYSKYKDRNGVERSRDFDVRSTINIIGGYKPNDTWEFGIRWQYQGGLPATPIDVVASENSGDTQYNASLYKTERLDDFHSLFVRIDRRFNFHASAMNIYLSVWNAYNRQNQLAQVWDPIKKEVKKETSMGMIPFLGVEYEF